MLVRTGSLGGTSLLYLVIIYQILSTVWIKTRFSKKYSSVSFHMHRRACPEGTCNMQTAAVLSLTGRDSMDAKKPPGLSVTHELTLQYRLVLK